jgi:hypothetical protein
MGFLLNATPLKVRQSLQSKVGNPFIRTDETPITVVVGVFIFYPNKACFSEGQKTKRP